MNANRALRLVSGALRSSALQRALQGIAAGTCLALAITAAISTVGLSMGVWIGLLIAATLGVESARRAGGSLGPLPAAGLLLVWVCVQTGLSSLAFDGLASLAGSALLTTAGGAAIGLAVGLPVLTLPGFLVGALATPHSPSGRIPGVFWASAVTTLLLITFLAPLLGGLQMCALVATIVVVVQEGVRVFLQRSAQAAAAGETEPPEPVPTLPPNAAIGWMTSVASAAIAGLAATVVGHILAQTMPAGLQGLLWGLSALTTGAVLAVGFPEHSAGTKTSRAAKLWSLCQTRLAGGIRLETSTWLCGVGLTMAVICFPWIVRAQLWANASVEIPFVVLSLRGGVLFLFLLPAGLLLGESTRRGERAAGSPGPSFALLSFVLSVICTRYAVMAGLPVTTLACIGVAACFGLTLTARHSRTTVWLPTGMTPRAALTGLLVAVLALPFLQSAYRPAWAARLVFATRAFQQYRAGVGAELLDATGDARLQQTWEAEGGTVSVWTQRGHRVEVRLNGIPVSVTSVNPDIAPHPPAGIVPTVLPLALHEQPRSVWLLGDVGPAAEAAALMFPIQSLVCTDTASLTATAVGGGFPAVETDDRVQRQNVSPAIVAAVAPDRYDVIISVPPQPALLGSAPYYTTDFYKRVATCMTTDGIFCQRFRQVDFGPGPLKSVLKSLSEAFASVSAVRIETGEILVLGTHAENIVRPGLALRLSRPHARLVLDDVGWDWSLLLDLATLDGEAIDAILGTSTEPPNTACNGLFACSLPMETMRWADKRLEMREELAAFQRRLLDIVEPDEWQEEASRRIADTREQRELIREFPDEPWIYRKTLRTRMEQQPRPAQERVVDGRIKRTAHPVDKHRVAYFETLSGAIRDLPEGIRGVRTLERFTSPHEPLVSYFARHEAARLYAKAREDVEAELKHRLHIVYYSDSSSRAVREVCSTVRLLLDHPETMPDPQARWDQLNSLLQVMAERWDTRGTKAPRSSRIVLNDIEQSLSALSRGLDELEQLQAEAGVDAGLCARRRQFLEAQLERPLRRYRQQVLPHHYESGDQYASQPDQAADIFRPLGN